MKDHKENMNRLQPRLRDLHHLLSNLLHYHNELIDVIQRKLLAMRKSDVDAIYACIASEEKLVEQIRDQENMRRRLMALIVDDLGLKTDGNQMTMLQLTDHLGQSQSRKLTAVATQLGHVMNEIAKVNKVVDTFAREMLSHYRHIFEDITQSIQDAATYCDKGSMPSPLKAQVVDLMS